MKNATKILALLGGASVLAVMAGLPVDANGFFLTEEQMTALDGHIDANELVAAELVTAKDLNATTAAEVARLTAELVTANDQLSSVNSQLSSVNDQLSTAQARIIALEALDTHKPAGTVADQDPAAADKTDKKKYLSAFDTMFG